MRIYVGLVAAALLAAILAPQGAIAATASEVTQYGIMWKFESPHEVGRFVNGDWWVIGPVNVVSVTPAPGPVAETTAGPEVKGRYGVVQFVPDTRMRNGSEILPDLPDKPRDTQNCQYALRKYWLAARNAGPVGADNMPQGFDSRDKYDFDPALTVSYPYTLKPGESLISSISYPQPFQQTYGHEIRLFSDGQSIIQTAAVLTCVDKAPPADAFRPPYAGTCKPIYETRQIRWDRLPKLAQPPQYSDARGRVVGAPPDWTTMAQLMDRPCIDRELGSINENCNTYGREFARLNGIATLMLMLDAPHQQKLPLMIDVLQRGIDYEGLMNSGQVWPPDGGINMGRKWIILFAGMLLDQPDFLQLPPWELWQEDTDTYYGTAWDGTKTALWQMTWHTGPRNGLPFEEIPPGKRGQREGFAAEYQITNSDSYPGEALAALLMGARGNWNHEAFFDYVDRCMRNDANILYFTKENQWTHTPTNNVGAPVGEAYDPFVNAMWRAYRHSVPDQPRGKINLKWTWQDIDLAHGYGTFVDNPPGSASAP